MKPCESEMGVAHCGENEKLIGRHVRPSLGQRVVMSEQGLQRRKDAGRSDPSRGSFGTIVRVNANWTCGRFHSKIALMPRIFQPRRPSYSNTNKHKRRPEEWSGDARSGNE